MNFILYISKVLNFTKSATFAMVTLFSLASELSAQSNVVPAKHNVTGSSALHCPPGLSMTGSSVLYCPPGL